MVDACNNVKGIGGFLGWNENARIPRLGLLSSMAAATRCPAHLLAPATIVNPNERLLKSDPPDISRPGVRAVARGTGGRDGGRREGEKGRKPHRLSYNLCSHLKETLPGGTGSRIARTPRVWSAA